MEQQQQTGEAPRSGSDPGASSPSGDGITIDKILDLLKSKDDTERYVGLAMLKSVLDNSPEIRQDAEAVRFLWKGLPASFLDRLLQTGSDPSNEDSKESLDLAVSVLHAFAALLPQNMAALPKFTNRIPCLVDAVLSSSEETSTLILHLLHSLASSAQGARDLIHVQDLSPLTEIAPAQPLVLDIFRFAWLNAMVDLDDYGVLSRNVDETIQGLTSSFTGTDAVTLLDFLASFLHQADPRILPSNPKWLASVARYIQKLVTSRPSREARSAYTNAAAALLQTYPATASKLLLADIKGQDRPFAYLLINLLLIDIRSSAPMLLEQLNAPENPATSRRLASAFDIVCIFIGHLAQSLEDESLDSLVMSPDNLLKLRKGISDTMSVAIEYLRDRWDASVAGAMSLHPDARIGKTEPSTGSHRTLTWDSVASTVDDDLFILSAVRALALWLREDDNELLQKEATGLMDMFMDLYQVRSPEKLDFRTPILVALEALATMGQGRELLLRHDGWQILSKDLTDILGDTSVTRDAASRGIDVIRVLLQIAEHESSGTAEEWMNLITTIAAWDVTPQEGPAEVREFQVAVLQLSCTLLVGASGGMRNRYGHSISAIKAIATQLSRCIGQDSQVREAMEDVLTTLDGFESHANY
ncbi:hypothetical protein CDD83_580 [Cordyceps sp. RAO-2017]|nr:hypothetical protein CDD83_580 [Cordyceps sp. RAO-2017]